MKRMVSLYIHIPFCVQKCHYCDFLSWKSTEEEKNNYLQKLYQEMEQVRKNIEPEYIVDTIFIGGGTPSSLSSEQLIELGERISRFPRSNDLEYSMEVNPGTMDADKILALKKMGVNRISIGLQSANNQELKILGRIHSYETFVSLYHLFLDSGFENINVDVMSAIPNQTIDSYQDTLQKVLQLRPKHISSYSLQIEEGTKFFSQYHAGLLSLPSEEEERKMYEMTEEILAGQGYHRYEISNYALTNYECKHNLGYWSLKEYIGLGLGAASYFQNYRFTNTMNLLEYPKVDEKKYISKEEQMEEYMFLGLRKMSGVSILQFETLFGVSFDSVYEEVTKKLIHQNLLTIHQDKLMLTKRGIDLSNRVLSEFLLTV